MWCVHILGYPAGLSRFSKFWLGWPSALRERVLGLLAAALECRVGSAAGRIGDYRVTSGLVCCTQGMLIPRASLPRVSGRKLSP